MATPHALQSAAGLSDTDERPSPWPHDAFHEDSWFSRDAQTIGQFRLSLELEGYAVVPGVLPPGLLAELRAATEEFETIGRDYSSRQRGCKLATLPDIDFDAASPFARLLVHPPTIDRLTEAYGGPPLLASAAYDVSHVGTPGISLHTDSQPYGSSAFGGIMFSGPVLTRVLYYLDDLTLDTSPFRCIPRSHLSVHSDGNPYSRSLPTYTTYLTTTTWLLWAIALPP